MKKEKQKLVFKSADERREYIRKAFEGTRIWEIFLDIERIIEPFRRQNEQYKQENLVK